MRLAVTGLHGQVVSAMIERAPRGVELIALGRPRLDLTVRDAVLAALRAARCDVIVNAAAYTEVDKAESEPEAAMRVNGDGAGYVAEIAAELRAPLIHLSTDYVFDGALGRPYREDDATAPTGAYGRSKLAGERRIAAIHPDHAILRTSWIYSPFGANFVTTMLRLAAGAGDELAVVTDEVGCPTYTGHLAPRLVQFAERRAAGVFHLAGAGHCSRNTFAKAIFEAAGLQLRVTETTQARLAMLAPRPPWSVLGSERGIEPLPSWRDGLAAYRALAPEVFGQ